MKAKRIADFIESIPESKIESSTILLGGACEGPADPMSTNGRCKNEGLFECIGSTNKDSCTNTSACYGSTNNNKCSNLVTQNPSTDSCPS